ncbi:MAG: YebC/PmpR family DNA-binding transcriptional regulator [Chloroflexi bacterium]|nr:YebC/PmpR family DNA-binding transcriptional regulator [Chloroflexota bacterium]
MSGHSKWSTIKHKKAAIDAKRGQIFTKIAREITVAARQAGGDPDMNPRLRLSLDKARSANMPMENMDRAIKKGTGADQDSANFEEIMYEGYSPGGAAVLLQVLTDNRNRTAPEVRAAFSKAGGNMGEAGSVAWIFTSKAVVTVEEIDDEKADEVALAAIDAGAEDFKVEDGTLEVYGPPSGLEAIRESVAALGVEAAQATVTMVPNNTVPLDDHTAMQTLKLLDRLEELDDVQQVFTNGDFSDDVLEEYRDA